MQSIPHEFHGQTKIIKKISLDIPKSTSGVTIRWRSNYYCCYYSDYHNNGLFVFLFDPKLATIYIWNPLCLPHWLLESNYFLKGTIFEQKGTITIAIPIPIPIVLFCNFYFVWKEWLRVVESFPDLIIISNVICNVIGLLMHYKYTLHSKSHSLCMGVHTKGTDNNDLLNFFQFE